MAVAWAAAIAALFELGGMMMQDNQLSSGSKFLKGQTRFDPTDLHTPFGSSRIGHHGTGQFNESSQMDAFRQALGMSSGNLLGGGMFRDPNFQHALQTNDIGGAMNNANIWNMTNVNPSGFDSTGITNNLTNLGFSNLTASGDLSGLIQQNLDASRLLSEPYENNLINRFNNQEFMSTRGATTGAFERQYDMQDALLRADAQRVLGAQQLGLDAQQFMSGLGMSQVSAGLGENQNNFLRYMSGLESGRSGGQQKLQNALGLFGMGQDIFGENYRLGLEGHRSTLDQNRLILDMMLGNLNAESNRIGATSGFGRALADLYAARGQSQQSGMSGIAGAIMGGFGG